jgi:6-phosphogluconolactonase
VSGGSTQLTRFTFDLQNGQLSAPTSTTVPAGSSYLAIDAAHRHLYAVDENTSHVGAYTLDPATGAPTAVNTAASGGTGPAHLSVDQTGAWVLVSNYGSGDVEVLPVQSSGGVGPATDQRHAGLKAHQIVPDAANHFVFVPCLGSDYIAQYVFDAVQGKLTPNTVATVGTATGAGPRHLAFHPSGKVAYSIQETVSTMTAYSYDAQAGQLTSMQTLSTLPTGFTGTNTGAEVWVHPSGRFLYGSNRGDDSIVEYALDAAGKMSLVGHTKTGGQQPRNFTIDSTGRWLLVANQSSNTVVEFSVDTSTGMLTQVGAPIVVPAGPTFVGTVTF